MKCFTISNGIMLLLRARNLYTDLESKVQLQICRVLGSASRLSFSLHILFTRRPYSS